MKWTIDQIPDRAGKTVVVTGANSGIGYEAAQALAGAGAHVILGCRNDGKGSDAARRIRAEHADASIRVYKLDLASLVSVREFAEVVRGELDRLDLLVNNAGVMMPPSRTMTVDGFELQFGTNHLGHFALTAMLLDVLVSVDGARIVTVSSGAHRWGTVDFDDLHWEQRPYKPAASYGQSKLANLLFTFELQRRLEKAGVGVIALAAHPGWTATDLQRYSRLFRALNPIFAMEPWQGALPTLFAATAPGAEGGAYYGPDGWLEMRGYPTRVACSDAARDPEAARRLWTISEELTDTRFALTRADERSGVGGS